MARTIPSSARVPYLKWAIGLGPRPFNATPDNVVRPAVSPSREVILHVRVSALKCKHTNELFVLLKGFVIIAPANVMAIGILVPPCLPITPYRSLRLTGVLFCDEYVGAFVGKDVFASTQDTSMLIIWPYELPFVVLSPRADWPFV